jgi:raffinose/stachyose/melibiose transport system substrate-binding protein
VPYLDYATPDFYDQITAGIQEMLAGKEDPQSFTKKIQDDYAKFTGSL